MEATFCNSQVYITQKTTTKFGYFLGLYVIVPISCKKIVIHWNVEKIIKANSYSCTFDCTNVLHQLSHNVQSAHACSCWCNKKVIVWLCVCTRDNTLAKARGLSSHIYAQTIQ